MLCLLWLLDLTKMVWLFNQLWFNNMNYDTHVGNDLNVNLPTSNNSKYDLETRPLHKLD